MVTRRSHSLAAKFLSATGFAVLLFPSSVKAQSAPAAAPEAVAAKAPVETSFQAQVEAFRKERNANLAKEDSWLTLVGLYWLEPGENRFGSDPGNRVVFPKGKLPPYAGLLVRGQDDKVRIQAEPGAGITVEGKPVTSLDLKSDNEEGTTQLEAGSVSFFVIRRGDRVGVRIKDRESEVRRSFKGLDFFPPNPAWRVNARFEPYQPPKKVPIPNVLGQVNQIDSPGAVVFEWQGKSYRLDALGSLEDTELSLIFGDLTNGHATYGAGRFLEFPTPKEGKAVVDFNLAYNPPCAFTAFATCPLPPRQNKLRVAVEAGEKNFSGGPHS